MKTLSIRELRASLTQLDKIVHTEGELIITRHGKPIARVVPAQARRAMAPKANLRRSLPKLGSGADLVRQDRDER